MKTQTIAEREERGRSEDASTLSRFTTMVGDISSSPSSLAALTALARSPPSRFLLPPAPFRTLFLNSVIRQIKRQPSEQRTQLSRATIAMNQSQPLTTIALETVMYTSCWGFLFKSGRVRRGRWQGLGNAIEKNKFLHDGGEDLTNGLDEFANTLPTRQTNDY